MYRSHLMFEQVWHLWVSAYDFPQDLRDAQIALHQAQCEYTRFARGPAVFGGADGRVGGRQKLLHSGYRPSKRRTAPGAPRSSTGRSPLSGPVCWHLGPG